MFDSVRVLKLHTPGHIHKRSSVSYKVISLHILYLDSRTKKKAYDFLDDCSVFIFLQIIWVI